jgi:hypothetical protein
LELEKKMEKHLGPSFKDWPPQVTLVDNILSKALILAVSGVVWQIQKK